MMNDSVVMRFSGKPVTYHFNGSLKGLGELTDPSRTVIITDRHLMEAHPAGFKGWKTWVLEPGEEHKVQSTVDGIIRKLIEWQVDRTFTLVGVGGGVVTDITGYTASVYMRGLRFGFVPSSLLAMVDASIGGKNGIDVGPYKNMVGVIRQPSFLLYDFDLLETLPSTEWSNGFAEIIKHACIRDLSAFRLLEKYDLAGLRNAPDTLRSLIRRNALLKSRIVRRDEFEKGERRLLNFGHTLGHALETSYVLSHGQAVSLGMVAACRISEGLMNFKQTERVAKVLAQYGLPVAGSFDPDQIMSVLRMDKKRVSSAMNYILLGQIGKGLVQSIPLDDLEARIRLLSNTGQALNRIDNSN
jgi:3-dehydroquinate synthase